MIRDFTRLIVNSIKKRNGEIYITDAHTAEADPHTQYAELATANTFTARQRISATFPQLDFYETDAAVGEKLWRWWVDGAVMHLDVRADDDSSSAAMLDVTRTGVGATTFNVRTTNLQHAGTAVSLSGHGAADHTNVTRSIWIPATAFTADGGTFATVGASPGQIRTLQLADALTQGGFFETVVPSDWASGAITMEPHWIAVNTVAGAAIRWLGQILYAGTAADWTAAGTASNLTGASLDRTANFGYIDSAISLGTPSAAGQTMRISLRRQGGNAADTYNAGTVALVGVMLNYTATQ